MCKIDTILLVEDDAITNFINQRLITKAGIANKILVSLNGEEALNLICKRLDNNEKCPDLILLDINMPVMDGFEFLERFHRLSFKEKEKVSIVMLTTSTHIRDMDKLVSFGNSCIISKPLNEEKLEEVIQKFFPEASVSKTA